MLERLQEAIKAATTEPYLLTVTGDGRPHCSCSAVIWNDGHLTTPVPRGWDAAQAGGHDRVTLLWPPSLAGGYSLIVDGVAGTCTIDGETRLALTPTRAVLHRRGTPRSEGGACGSDCVPILPA